MSLKSNLWRRKIIIPGLSLPALWPPGVLAYGLPPCVCLCVWAWPVHHNPRVSPHYHIGYHRIIILVISNRVIPLFWHQEPMQSSEKYSNILIIQKKYLSPSANRKYLKSLEIWQYIVHNIFLCSPKIFISGPLMLKWYDIRCEDDIVGPFSHCFYRAPITFLAGSGTQ